MVDQIDKIIQEAAWSISPKAMNAYDTKCDAVNKQAKKIIGDTDLAQYGVNDFFTNIVLPLADPYPSFLSQEPIGLEDAGDLCSVITDTWLNNFEEKTRNHHEEALFRQFAEYKYGKPLLPTELTTDKERLTNIRINTMFSYTFSPEIILLKLEFDSMILRREPYPTYSLQIANEIHALATSLARMRTGQSYLTTQRLSRVFNEVWDKVTIDPEITRIKMAEILIHNHSSSPDADIDLRFLMAGLASPINYVGIEAVEQLRLLPDTRHAIKSYVENYSDQNSPYKAILQQRLRENPILLPVTDEK